MLESSKDSVAIFLLFISVALIFVVLWSLLKAHRATRRWGQLRNHYLAILQNIGEGMIVYDKHGKVELVNPAAQKMLGCTETELLGMELHAQIRAEDDNGHAVPIAHLPSVRVLKHDRTYIATFFYVRKNGKRFPVQVNASPVTYHGRNIGAVELFRNITHELELDKAKTDFVSLVSHQLRTPLSAINWYTEMLLNGDAGAIKKEQEEYVREIYDGNQRMIELIEALLDVSRLELGKLKNEPQDVPILDLVESLEKELATNIQTKQINYTRDAKPSLPNVSADPKLLRMILENLLVNSVKYTPDKGRVTLSLHRATPEEVASAKLPDVQPYLFISVADTGYGIPKNQQHTIFQKLFRADNVRLDFDGTGLGLYIVKQATEKLGGSVWFHSIENQGTTFYVVIPFKTHATTPLINDRSDEFDLKQKAQ